MTHALTSHARTARFLTARAATALLVVLGVLVGLAPAALAGPPPVLKDRVNVAPGIVREVYRYQGAGGGVDIQALRFRADDPRVRFSPELADGKIPGMEATHEVVKRLEPEGALAAVNAHFFSWSGTPIGDPVGLMVRHGEYLSQPEKSAIWRGGLGITKEGQVSFGHPGYRGRIWFPETTDPFSINAVNRWPKGPTENDPNRWEMTVFTPGYDRSTGTSAGTVEVVFRPYEMTPTHKRTVTVQSIGTAGNTAIPRDGIVLAGTGNIGKEMLKQLRPGSEVTLDFQITEGWEALEHALQGGPMLLKDGGRTSHASWYSEGFDPSQHSDKRHPRTAVGRHANGDLMLITMDGRSSQSAGLSMHDAQTALIHMGVKDAVMMDGGGSTQMVVDDVMVNRPSDSAGFRRVATNLVLRSTATAPDIRRLGVGDSYRIAADIARTGWPQGTDTVILASSHTFADALAGGGLASERDLPILLTRPDAVPSTTIQAMKDLRTRDVIILGGTKAVTESVEKQLRDQGFRPRRVSGVDRVATAARLATIIKAPNGRAFLASADSWADSASATVPAALSDSPLLLTYTRELHPQVLTTLKHLDVTEVVIAGGTAAVSAEVESALETNGFRVVRLAGKDRFGTSAALASWSEGQPGGTDPHTAMLARGDSYRDAIVAGPLAAKERKAVLLIDRLGMERSTASYDWLKARDLATLSLVGDRATLSTWVGYQGQQLLDR